MVRVGGGCWGVEVLGGSFEMTVRAWMVRDREVKRVGLLRCQSQGEERRKYWGDDLDIGFEGL